MSRPYSDLMRVLSVVPVVLLSAGVAAQVPVSDSAGHRSNAGASFGPNVASPVLERPESQGWFVLGGGIMVPVRGTGGSRGGLVSRPDGGVNVDLLVKTGSRVVRAGASAHVRSLCFWADCSAPEAISEVHFGVGLGARSTPLRFLATAGPSLAYVVNTDNSRQTMFGVAAQADVLGGDALGIGFGVGLLATLRGVSANAQISLVIPVRE